MKEEPTPRRIPSEYRRVGETLGRGVVCGKNRRSGSTPARDTWTYVLFPKPVEIPSTLTSSQPSLTTRKHRLRGPFTVMGGDPPYTTKVCCFFRKLYFTNKRKRKRRKPSFSLGIWNFTQSKIINLTLFREEGERILINFRLKLVQNDKSLLREEEDKKGVSA